MVLNMQVDCVIEAPVWEEAGLERLASVSVNATLSHLGLDPTAYEVAVLGCDDARIAELNAEFRGKPAPTNVLSWPAEELSPGDRPGESLGDIAIAYGVCRAEATAGDLSFDDHATHLLVHATLHLLGYDHQNDADAYQMETIEREILGNLGIKDPY